MRKLSITVTGATGFVGEALLARLAERGHSVHVLGRRRLRAFAGFTAWDAESGEPPADALAGRDAVIHLAGAPVAQRWTEDAKRRIHASRVDGTRNLVNALSTIAVRPRVLISASAVGYYGSRGDEVLDEASAPGGDFLARVCIDWEQAAELAESLGIRVVRLRVGIVLGPGGGALDKMLPPFRFGLGGKLASGRQWMSWIHRADLIGMIEHALEDETVAGPANATAPSPVTNAEFTRELAAALKRPALFRVPGFALKLAYGEMAKALLGSQRVLPRAMEAAGYRFEFADLRPALENALHSP